MADAVFDAVFVSKVSLALYLLPLLFAGVGIHLVSHVLITTLRMRRSCISQPAARARKPDIAGIGLVRVPDPAVVSRISRFFL